MICGILRISPLPNERPFKKQALQISRFLRNIPAKHANQNATIQREEKENHEQS